MSKNTRKISMILSIVAMVFVVFIGVASPVLAITEGDLTTFPEASGGLGNLNTAASNLWGVVLTIVRILAFAAIIFAGVRYMFASADQKADIKKGMIFLALGAALVFASSTIIEIIVKAVS